MRVTEPVTKKKIIIESPTGFRAYVKRHKIHTDSVNGSSRMMVSILAGIFFFFFLLLCFHLSQPMRKSIDHAAWDKEKILSPWQEFEVHDLLK